MNSFHFNLISDVAMRMRSEVKINSPNLALPYQFTFKAQKVTPWLSLDVHQAIITTFCILLWILSQSLVHSSAHQSKQTNKTYQCSALSAHFNLALKRSPCRAHRKLLPAVDATLAIF